MPVQCPSKIKQHKSLDVTINIPRSILMIRALASPPGCSALLGCSRSANNSACMSPISHLMSPSLGESLSSVPDAYAIAVSGVSGAETYVHTPALGESEAQNRLPDSILSSGGSGGDGNAAGAVYLARRSPIEGGDSEVILAPVVAVSVEGSGMTDSVPSGGETSSLVGITTAESAGAKCSSFSSSSSFVPEPIYPEYIPLEDENILSAEEQPLPPVVSPTAKSPGYVAESDPEEDPKEYKDDETEDGLVDYPMDRGDDRDDDVGDSFGDDADNEDEEDEEKEEHLAPADSAVVIPTNELVSPCRKEREYIKGPGFKCRQSISISAKKEEDKSKGKQTYQSSGITLKSFPRTCRVYAVGNAERKGNTSRDPNSNVVKVPLEIPCGSTFETTISLRIFPIVPLSIRNVCIARTSAVAGKVPYFATLVALLGTRAIVMKMALGALGQIPTVRLPLTCPHIVNPGDILSFGGLLLVTMVIS
nr:hypothetical protein [Tanacetum cinerariifolium]